MPCNAEFDCVRDGLCVKEALRDCDNESGNVLLGFKVVLSERSMTLDDSDEERDEDRGEVDDDVAVGGNADCVWLGDAA